ncbi:MAG: TonB-dependent receptor, partial [Nitrospirae bacterium]|nr:TonB-dependent receptor [Nitrospirota bacterium]
NTNNIIKAQFANAFRPPTFLELYSRNNLVSDGNRNIVSETVNTREIGYIYQLSNFKYKVNVFYSDLSHIINVDENSKYGNIASAYSRGAEMETEVPILPLLTVNGNVSYSYATDKTTSKELAGSAKWLGNMAVLYQPLNNITLALQNRYVGKIAREPYDSRLPLTGYYEMDFTLSYDHMPIKGLTFRSGIKNVFNANILEPNYQGFYYDNRRYPRQWWVQLSYRF